MHASRSLPTAFAALLLTAVPAAAQVPVPTPTPTAPVPTATPAPPAAPAAGKLAARLSGSVKDGGKRYVLAGDTLKVEGRLKPGVAGQRVQVLMRLAGGKAKTRKATVKGSGRFSVKVRARTPGKLALRVLHKKSGKIARAESDRLRLRVLAPSALRFGSDGPLARVFNRKLRALEYAAPKSGAFDDATSRAVMAYRKVNNLGRSFSVNADIVRSVLDGRGAYEVRHPELGKHVEADISQQILALVDGDEVVRVFHTSSGAPATPTVLGTYRFYMQQYGTNGVGMVHSSYFIRGYAIHGYPSVPAYNASHGCLRVPIPDAFYIYDWIELGDQIRVDA